MDSITLHRIESALCEYDDYAGKWLTHSIDSGACRWCERSTRSIAYAAQISIGARF